MTIPDAQVLPAPGQRLVRLADEVSACVQLLAAIEAEVALMIPAAPVRAASSLHPLQKIDLLAQTLADLAICLSGLGKGTFPHPLAADWAEAALSALRLEDLRGRLAGHAALRGVAPGAVEFF